MPRYKAIVKWCEEYELEIEADNESEAYDKAVQESTDTYACDSYLLDVQLDEVDDE